MNNDKRTPVLDGETFKLDGLTFRVKFLPDESAGTPWEREDGHGVVSDWTRREKRAGERVLNQDRGSYRYYDFAGAVVIARLDGWDTEPYGQGTARERASRAAEVDYERLRSWCNDDWSYIGVVVTLLDVSGVNTRECESRWGIESDDSEHITDTAYELAGEIGARVTGDRVFQVVRA